MFFRDHIIRETHRTGGRDEWLEIAPDSISKRLIKHWKFLIDLGAFLAAVASGTTVNREHLIKETVNFMFGIGGDYRFRLFCEHHAGSLVDISKSSTNAPIIELLQKMPGLTPNCIKLFTRIKKSKLTSALKSLRFADIISCRDASGMVIDPSSLPGSIPRYYFAERSGDPVSKEGLVNAVICSLTPSMERILRTIGEEWSEFNPADMDAVQSLVQKGFVVQQDSRCKLNAPLEGLRASLVVQLKSSVQNL